MSRREDNPVRTATSDNDIPRASNRRACDTLRASRKLEGVILIAPDHDRKKERRDDVAVESDLSVGMVSCRRSHANAISRRMGKGLVLSHASTTSVRTSAAKHPESSVGAARQRSKSSNVANHRT